ncbi:bifunctional [glutamine synthetase] adenylyltransferase/[glutamine synthetase]-adenylyl-L-tyrosine phosphorylase [Oryzifoliimicrobium ureilyticus]|uniref:bifunctional [glutamine synthetase] adenylyltransferase/[glutamine synthetase]-adenylyl-L-tyrosine phosphorylase n=1 Tax=Oryzifoliimicrobium ureilyticus TaxID=3113724 RepID=UPI0030765CE9
MQDKAISSLKDVDGRVLKPLNQSELKSAQNELRELCAVHPNLKNVLVEGGHLWNFLIAVFSLSPYLRDCARLDPEALAEIVNQPVKVAVKALIDDARDAWLPRENGAVTETELMARLRVLKRRAALFIALGDLSKIFDARSTTELLSELAEACVSAAIDHLLLSANETGKLKLPDPGNPSYGSGLIVLGMGKLGAGELNYSSDIDLVVFFNPDAGIVAAGEEPIEVFPRLVRRLVRILQERTGDGYVFRSDLRLRPDPGSTPLALSVDAAMIYYEGRGQNWERAAFIKAKPVAGDLIAGQEFLRGLLPFVFRKYLDYAAIADIHSIKRQIHAHKGHGNIAVKGHNVKLGRGGIREIEFFVQTQQLIAGGRMANLRDRRTEATLATLAQSGWIDEETRQELKNAYWFLRDVEHRIQMVHDEQTHLLPQTDAELRRIAYLMGFEDIASFSARLVDVLKTVERRYARLFEQENHLSGASGNLVFTGQNDDPDTLLTLQKLGFERPADISRVIRIWHYGRYRATQSVEARERLTELTPELLRVFGESRRADEALLRFDGFISGLPAGIQLFSLMGSNPPLLSLIVTIMSAAPKLAEVIAARPHVFDGMLDPGLISELPTRVYLASRLETSLSQSRHYEETLDRLRIFAAEQRFLIGIRLLTGAIGGVAAGKAFTHLADLVIEAAFVAVANEMQETHGVLPGMRLAVLGMGKLGSFELTAGSDVDLILLYDFHDAAEESNGVKPLDPTRYFTRLTQRLIAALSAPTAEGVVYEVDMRLRPSGNKGPVATRMRSFANYQRREAWTWEHMALTRARLICGDQSLIDEASVVIADVIGQSRDRTKIVRDVLEMREMIDKEKPPKSLWDLKLIPGGVVDIEFICQFLSLMAPAARCEDVSSTNTRERLEALGPHFLSSEDLELCLSADKLYTELSQLVRLCIDGVFDPREAPAGLIDFVCRAGETPDIKSLEGEIKHLSREVRRVFHTVVS